MTAIFKRELKSYFHGMMGYVLTAFLLATSGLYFLALDLGYVLLVMGPAGVVYCMNYPVTALSVAYFIISTLLLPLMVQAFSCLVAWVISLISSKMRNKNIITMVVSLLFYLRPHRQWHCHRGGVQKVRFPRVLLWRWHRGA